MNYYLDIDIYDSTNKLVLTLDEFKVLKHSKGVLDNAFSIEEKYDLLISNYTDLEKDMFEITVNNSLRWGYKYEDFYESRALINRRIVSVLTMARLYIDSLPKLVFKCSGAQVEPTKIKEMFSTQYDSFLEYRFIEALRNFVQHYNLPIHSWTNGVQHLPVDGVLLAEFSSTFFAQKKEFENDGSFKKNVLNEIPESINLIEFIRKYINSLNIVHLEVRELIQFYISNSRDIFSKYINEFSEKNDNRRTNGLEAFCKEGSEVLEQFSVLLDHDDVRVGLVKRNKTLKHLTSFRVKT